MADTKITALAAITTVDPAADVLPIVDISDTSMAASGTTKKITSNQILGAGGTATLASATITGDLTVRTNKLAVTSAGVGFGTTSPNSSFQATLSGLYGLRIQSADTNNSVLNIGTDPASGYAFVDVTKDGSGSFLPLRFSTSDTERIRISTAGDVSISTGNVVMATSGKGIDFSATAGTGTSELLNDYEEGTFTPTAGDASSGGNQATTATAVGRYTKVGRLVTVHFELTDINTTGLTAGNSLYIRGLPFTASSATTQYGTITGAGITFSGFLTCGVFNSTAFPIYATSTGGSLADIKVSGFASGTADIFGTLTYFV